MTSTTAHSTAGDGTPTVLVTGATGKTGSALVRHLLARGTDVRAGTRSPAAYDVPGATPTAFSWTDSATWSPALDGVDAVWAVVQDDWLAIDRDYVPFLAAARDAGVGTLVQLSADGVEHAPPDVPLRAAELATLDAGLPRVGIVRPSWFAQNFDAGLFAEGIRRRGELRAPTGDGRVGFVDTRDIAAVAAAMLLGDVPPEEATVTGPEALSFGEAAAALSLGSGSRIVHVDLSVERMREELAAFGVPTAYAETLLELFAALREGRSDGLSDAVERLTGTAPRSLRTYAEDHAAALRGPAAAA